MSRATVLRSAYAQDDQGQGDGVNELAVLYETHYTRLVRLARQFVDDVESAEEVVQDVFIRLHHAASDRSDIGYPYLRTAVMNQCRSVLRRRALARRARPQTWSRDSDSVVDPAIGITDRDFVRSCISTLPRRQKEVLVLRYFEDLPLKDIAATLGISVNATSVALSRAIESISSRHRGAER